MATYATDMHTNTETTALLKMAIALDKLKSQGHKTHILASK